MIGSAAGVIKYELGWFGEWLSSRPRRKGDDNSGKLDRRQ